MPRYPYLLFDADDTLFSFSAANRVAFAAACAVSGLTFSDELLAQYEVHNSALWRQFDRGEVSKEFLVLERFRRFFAELGIDADPRLANDVHLTALGNSAVLLPHAAEVVKTLARTHRLFVVTNAVARVQKSRLSQSEIAPYIERAFISEEIGAAKPKRAYFDYVFAHVDGITRDNCLLVGDSLTSDILGANEYGLRCCWFNPDHAPNHAGLHVDYEIADLRELYDIV